MTLSKADKRLSELIQVIGTVSIFIQDNYYVSLIQRITGQQLSIKASNTIWNRLLDFCPKPTPQSICEIEDKSFREIGISRQKITYIRDLTNKVLSGEVNLSSLPLLNNNDVILELSKIKGIGSWTAEMFLIFSLGRMNILSLGDVGLQRATKWVYNVEDQVNGKDYLEQKASLWEPYCTIAALYLWEGINRGYVDSFDSLDEVVKDNEFI
ncbi:DNA-3-methyladenine glycosylase family protein [Paenibacillus sp. y28]|uniref:DNA-3-methyladenine glycosylase family protein n=1 Tax=Paenibacillus sp. y28 TaxID=3129110 RepID=UPI00301B61A7